MEAAEPSTPPPPDPQADRPPDGVLLEKFVASRSEAAFAALVQRYGPLVYGVCWRVLRHVQEAEDAFQATFLVLARKAGSVRRGATLSAGCTRAGAFPGL